MIQEVLETSYCIVVSVILVLGAIISFQLVVYFEVFYIVVLEPIHSNTQPFGETHSGMVIELLTYPRDIRTSAGDVIPITWILVLNSDVRTARFANAIDQYIK